MRILRPLRWLLPLALAAAPVSAEAPPARGWEWTVKVAPDLARLDVRLCFGGFRPRRLTLGLPGAGAGIAPAPAGPGRFGLQPDGDGYVPLENGGTDAGADCVEYAVDVGALPAARGRGKSGPEWLADPRSWLLAPASWPEDVRATVRFELPEGVAVSVPWEPVGPRTWRLPPSSLVGDSLVALGRFAPYELDVAGTRLHVAPLAGTVQASRAGVDRWLTAAVGAVAGLYGGRFPVPRVQVLVDPAGRGDSPVPFGTSKQAGGAAVHLLLAADAKDAALPGEWVAIHELTHLGMPWVTPHDAWFTEGFVTYYQEVLRARAGFLDGPWQDLHEGFERGRRGGAMLPLAEESRLMGERHSFHRVYWGGAALALRCDLALRAATGGKRSLDDAMRVWADNRFDAVRGWRALDLLQAADEALGTRVLVEAVRPGLEMRELPPVEDLYAALGITVEGGRVRLSPDPAPKALRDAIGAKR